MLLNMKKQIINKEQLKIISNYKLSIDVYFHRKTFARKEKLMKIIHNSLEKQ